MKRFEFNLAWALMKSRKGRWYPNANVLLSVLGIAVGITFLVFTVCMYDGYIKKLETIIFSIFPHITLQADVIDPSEEADDDFYESLIVDNTEEKQCDSICQSNGILVLDDKASETATSLMKGKAFDLKLLDNIHERMKDIPGVVKLSPVILEEGNFVCNYSRHNQNTKKAARLRVLGVDADHSNVFVPEINRSIENPGTIKKLDHPDKHIVIFSAALYQEFFGDIPDASKFPQHVSFQFQVTTNEKQTQKTISLEIVDIFKLGIHQITQNLMITSLHTAQELFDTQQYASFLGMNLDDPYSAKLTADSVKDQLLDTDILTFNWLDVAADMFNNLNLYRNIIITILLMSIMITGFIIYNTLHIMIIERKRQIGTLMALGISKGSIYNIFIIISQFEAITGFLFGSFVGVLSGHYFGNYLNMQLREYLPIQDAGIVIHGWSMLVFFLFVSGICLTTALLSAGKAARLDPVQCLQSE